MSSPVDLPKILQLDEDLNKRFAPIPFGNSLFQNENFVVNAQYTPARAYRAIGLALSARIRALKEAYFSHQRALVGIAELEEQLTDSMLGKYDRIRKELDLQEKQSNVSYLEKLVKDAAFEVETFSSMLKKFPEYTREQFEAEERLHFEQRLKLQAAGIQGAHDSLFCMGYNTKEVAQNILQNPNYQKVLDTLALPNTQD